jgi:hypothetical protein
MEKKSRCAHGDAQARECIEGWLYGEGGYVDEQGHAPWKEVEIARIGLPEAG